MPRGPRWYTDETLRSPTIAALMNKVSARLDADFDARMRGPGWGHDA